MSDFEQTPSSIDRLDERDITLARSPSSRFPFAGSARSARRSRVFSTRDCRKSPARWNGYWSGGAPEYLLLDTPGRAAVDLAVRAARAEPAAAPFAALANSILRNLARERQEILDGSDALDDDTPAWLAARWRANSGASIARAIALANRDEPTLDLSVKSDAEGWARRPGRDRIPDRLRAARITETIFELEGYNEGEWWVRARPPRCRRGC